MAVGKGIHKTGVNAFFLPFIARVVDYRSRVVIAVTSLLCHLVATVESKPNWLMNCEISDAAQLGFATDQSELCRPVSESGGFR